MASIKFSYQRLKRKPTVLEEEGGGVVGEEVLEVSRNTRSWLGLRRRFNSRRWRRPRVRIPGLRRLLRRKTRLLGSAVRVSFGRVVKRFKDGRSHFGDLFAGNYMFMQVSPAPLGCLEKSFMVGHEHALPPSCRHYLPKVA